MKHLQPLFPTLVYCAPLMQRGAIALNRELVREAQQIREADAAGRAWSAERYPGGYTSYGSLDQLQRMSGTVMRLRGQIDRHVRRYARAQHWDLQGGHLVMTDCWLNIMSRLCAHGSHIHPQSVVSGTYYVRMPRGASALKFEDPRLSAMMAAPPRADSAPPELHAHHSITARAGDVVLFESWLRHEVPASRITAERISLSFNYHWLPGGG